MHESRYGVYSVHCFSAEHLPSDEPTLMLVCTWNYYQFTGHRRQVDACTGRSKCMVLTCAAIDDDDDDVDCQRCNCVWNARHWRCQRKTWVVHIITAVVSVLLRARVHCRTTYLIHERITSQFPRKYGRVALGAKGEYRDSFCLFIFWIKSSKLQVETRLERIVAPSKCYLYFLTVRSATLLHFTVSSDAYGCNKKNRLS